MAIDSGHPSVRKGTSVLIGGMIAAGMCSLVVTHWLQIGKQERAERAFRQEATRIASVWQRRAPLCDRYGSVLNATVDSHALAVHPSRLRDIRHTRRQTLDLVEGEVSRLALDLWPTQGQFRRVHREDLAAHLLRASPMPFILWRDLDTDTLERWLLVRDDYPGIDLLTLPKRTYHLPDLAPLTRGRIYLTRRGPGESLADCDFPDLTMAGWFGLERQVDSALRGDPGLKTLLLDAVLFRQKTRLLSEPAAGSAVYTTLDMRIQRWAQQALDGLTGALVVMRCDGELLALANHSAEEPVLRLDSGFHDWQDRLITRRDQDLNRCLADETGPGSLMKLAVALAALEEGVIRPETELICTGAVRYSPTMGIRCHSRNGHGSINLIEALRLSCNAYFLQLADMTGWAPIVRMMESLGLGQRPGDGFGDQPTFVMNDACKPGVIYSPAIKRAKYSGTADDVWRRVDTGFLALGQADMRVTPLQAAIFTNSIVTGIRVCPRLLRERTPTAAPIVAGEVARSLVLQGMRQVIHHPRGTGRYARVDGAILAGKTGTCERGGAGEDVHDVWMVLIYPGDMATARIVVAAMAHGGSSGGRDLGPRLARLIEKIAQWEQETKERREDRRQTAATAGRGTE